MATHSDSSMIKNALNDGGEFERCYHEIYPPEMELGKENVSDNAASFLDLNISIIDSLSLLLGYMIKGIISRSPSYGCHINVAICHPTSFMHQ